MSLFIQIWNPLAVYRGLIKFILPTAVPSGLSSSPSKRMELVCYFEAYLSFLSLFHAIVNQIPYSGQTHGCKSDHAELPL